MLGWKFNRIPKEKHQTVIEAFEGNDIKTLIQIYNEHKVYPAQTLAQCCALKAIVDFTNYAIENKLIIQTHEPET